jgi:hypothetical protein
MKRLIFAASLVLATPVLGADLPGTEVHADKKVSAVGSMALGCLLGGGVGAFIGIAAPLIVTVGFAGAGAVIAPYTVPQTATLGCIAGTVIGIVGSTLYNAVVSVSPPPSVLSKP